MFWLSWTLALLGLFVVGNVVVACLPPYQRWMHRRQEYEAVLLEEARVKAATAVQEALLELVTQAYMAEVPPWEKPRVRIPAVSRRQS